MNFDLNIPVTILKEGKRFVAYTPALDLSTSGKTLAEAKKRFEEAAKIFIEEIAQHGTLEEALSDLGWKKTKSAWQSPVVISQETERLQVSV